MINFVYTFNEVKVYCFLVDLLSYKITWFYKLKKQLLNTNVNSLLGDEWDWMLVNHWAHNKPLLLSKKG